jgi:hypothetical protein
MIEQNSLIPKADHRRSDTCVLILGAGFSAPWGPPVMASFMNEARRQYFNHREWKNPLAIHYERMLDFHRECRSSSWMFNRDWDNIEELYTQADLIRLAYGDEKSGWDDQPGEFRCKHIAWAIWDVCRICKVDDPPPLGALISQIREYLDLKVAIITTNYDVLCEVGLNHQFNRKGSHSDSIYPGFLSGNVGAQSEGIISTGAAPSLGNRPRTTVPIIKLHGSINWFETQEAKRWYAFCAFGKKNGQAFGINDPSFKIEDVGKVLAANGVVEEASPAIVPPMLGKSTVHSVVAEQWRAAIEALERAKRIYIVGYSFPETDIFMLRLLTEGLKRNEDLQEITVVNKEELTEPWRTKLHRFFTPVARQNRLWFVSRESKRLLNEFDQDGNAFEKFENERRRVL